MFHVWTTDRHEWTASGLCICQVWRRVVHIQYASVSQTLGVCTRVFEEWRWMVYCSHCSPSKFSSKLRHAQHQFPASSPEYSYSPGWKPFLNISGQPVILRKQPGCSSFFQLDIVHIQVPRYLPVHLSDHPQGPSVDLPFLEMSPGGPSFAHQSRSRPFSRPQNPPKRAHHVHILCLQIKKK